MDQGLVSLWTSRETSVLRRHGEPQPRRYLPQLKQLSSRQRGWSRQWGKFVTPMQASRFHLVVIVSMLVGAMVLPLTYLPILLVANDPDYMGEQRNARLLNFLA